MATNGVKYSVQFRNHSSNNGSVCVYQTQPDLSSNVMSLAWFTQYVYQTSTATYSWSIDYSFVWAETGELMPGITFLDTQNWSADLSTTNKVTFTHDAQHGAYTFKDQTAGSAGSLTIVEDNTIPLKQASVGIGMSGAGTFVVQAQPNLSLIFTPHPQYWITFGNYTQGEVLDITSITNAALLSFPTGVYSLVATLNQDNTWTIEPLAQANAGVVAASRGHRRRHPHPLHAPVDYPLSQIEVKNWAGSTTYATAATGTYGVDGNLKQVIMANPVVQVALTEGTSYLIYSNEYPAMAMVYNGTTLNGDLWFVSQ